MKKTDIDGNAVSAVKCQQKAVKGAVKMLAKYIVVMTMARYAFVRQMQFVRGNPPKTPENAVIAVSAVKKPA